MTSMNRRQVLMGGGMAFLAEAMTPSGFALGGLGGEAPAMAAMGGQPQHLLATAFPESTLAQTLLPLGAWHPFPKASDRDGWMALPQDLRDGLLARAEKANTGDWPQLLATTMLDFLRNGNRTRYEAVSFGRRRRVADLVIGECIAGDGRFMDQITNGIWLICEESFWGASAHLGGLAKDGSGLPNVADPVVDLFAAETSAQLAWMVYLLADKMDAISPLLRPRIHLEAKRRVLDPNLARVDFWWMGLGPTKRLLNNWTAWIDSNWLATALLLEEDPQRRVAGVAKACKSLDLYISDYSADGACAEGPGYWSKSAGSYYDAAWLMIQGTGGKDPGVLTNPFVKSMADYVLNVHIARNMYVNYGDAHVTAAPEPALLYRFGKASGDVPLQEFAAFYGKDAGYSSTGEALTRTLARGGDTLPRELPDIFGAAELRKAPGKDVLTRDSWYPALGLMTAREKANDPKGFFIALQAANVGRSHGHEDSGSFLVYHDAEPVFIDLGVGTYTKQTFSTDRYKILAMQSGYHNLPTIGGMREADSDHTRASDFQYATDDQRARITLNLATAYPPDAGAKRWMRTLALNRNDGAVEIHEEFELEKSVPVVLSFITTRKAANASDGVVTLTGENASVRPVKLSFDPKQLKASFETFDLTFDAGLEHAWGKEVYRVMLESVGPVTKGNWALRVS